MRLPPTLFAEPFSVIRPLRPAAWLIMKGKGDLVRRQGRHETEECKTEEYDCRNTAGFEIKELTR